MPTTEISLAHLSRQKYFTRLDLKKAFYGVELFEESIPKMAILTRCGLFDA